MIPKKIHYIWFGGKAKPAHIEATVASWKTVLPDYEILEWNEENIDITMHPWMERMHHEGKYAFASDWARLYILREHGGIYLDTDVEVKKPFDPFLGNGMFWGFEYNCYLATCVTGSRAGHPLLDKLLAEYDGRMDAPINNAVVTKFFLREFPEFRLNNTNQRVGEDIAIQSKEYFSVPSFDPCENFCRHHGSNLWKEGGKQSSTIKGLVRRLLGEVLYFKIVSHKVCRINEFYPTYKQHKKSRFW